MLLLSTLFSTLVFASEKLPYAPMSTYDALTGQEVLVQKNGLGLAWIVQDVEGIDYEKTQTDEEYGLKVVSDHDSKIRNVLYNVESKKIVSTISLAEGDEFAYGVCFSGKGFNANHRDCSFDFDPSTGYVVFTVDAKWNTVNVATLRLAKDLEGGLMEVAQTNQTATLDKLYGASLDRRFATNAQYREDRDRLVFTYTVNSLKAGPEKFSAEVSGTASANVPKGEDNFSDQSELKVILVQNDMEIAIKTVSR